MTACLATKICEGWIIQLSAQGAINSQTIRIELENPIRMAALHFFSKRADQNIKRSRTIMTAFDDGQGANQ
jgi:hypothetical protein